MSRLPSVRIEQPQGTPKTLTEAIKGAQSDFVMQAMKRHKSRARWPRIDGALIFKAHLRDFLAQRFNAAMLNAESDGDSQAVARLHALFKEIVGESGGG